MKIIARFSVELDGHIYSRGDACQYGGAITRRIAANFTAEDGSALTAEGPDGDAGGKAQGKERTKEGAAAVRAAMARTVEVMGRDGIKRALDSMGVAYPPSANTEYLAKALLVARGECEG